MTQNWPLVRFVANRYRSRARTNPESSLWVLRISGGEAESLWLDGAK
jgi:hypothetical protein